MNTKNHNKPHSVQRTESLEVGVKFESPLPPADELAKYNQLDPNAFKDIMQMAKNHNKVNTTYRPLLLLFAFILSMFFLLVTLGISVYFAIKGNTTLAMFYGSIPILTFLTTLIKKI